jgi:hypothetical protein
MDYSDTSVSGTDFRLNLQPPSTTPCEDESLIPDRARYLDSDDVYPPPNEKTALVTEPAAESVVSGVNPELDHNRYAETADDVSGTQFTAKETDAKREIVEAVLSGLALTLQNFRDDCVAASTKAAQDAIGAQRTGVPSWVSAADESNSAASYLSPTPSLADLNHTSVYDSVHEPTIFQTPSYTSVVSPPASELSSPSLAPTDLSIEKARKKGKARKKKKIAARLAATRGTANSRVTADWETRQATRLREHQAWQEGRATRELDFQKQRAARDLDRETREAARNLDWETRKATREARQEAQSLEFQAQKAIWDRECSEAQTRRLAFRAERAAQNLPSDATYGIPQHMRTSRATDNGKVLEKTVEFSRTPFQSPLSTR